MPDAGGGEMVRQLDGIAPAVPAQVDERPGELGVAHRADQPFGQRVVADPVHQELDERAAKLGRELRDDVVHRRVQVDLASRLDRQVRDQTPEPLEQGFGSGLRCAGEVVDPKL